MAEDIFGIVGSKQGPFTVERVVARGGFGVVYRAHHDAFRAPVALKCLKVTGAIPEAQRAKFLEQFREEAEMLFRLSAAIPAVVRPLHHDVLSTAGGLFVPFIALEWLEGATLASFIESRAARRLPPLGPEEAAELLAPVARALEAAHHFPGPSGPICVVHRDVKPSNIFLARLHGAQVVKVLDFGIARAKDAAQVIAGESITTTGSAPTAFTPRYGAPEQWAPRRFGATGPWTDVWGLALTFVEVLAGRPVIDGDPMALMGTILDEKRRPTPRTEGIRVNDATEAAFRRALALDPRDRPADAGVFWDELERALGLTPTAAPIPRPGTRASRPALEVELGSVPPSGSAPTELADRSPLPVPARGSSPALDAVRSPLPAPARGSSPALEGGATVVDAVGARAGEPPTMPSNQDAPRREGLPPRPKRPAPRPAPTPPPSPRPAGDTVRSMSLDWDRDLEAHRHDQPPRVAPHVAPHLAPRAAPTAELKTMFALPLRLAGAGVVVSVLDQAAATLLFEGQRVFLGPVRLIWVAAALVLIGLALAVFRLLGSSR